MLRYLSGTWQLFKENGAIILAILEAPALQEGLLDLRLVFLCGVLGFASRGDHDESFVGGVAGYSVPKMCPTSQIRRTQRIQVPIIIWSQIPLRVWFWAPETLNIGCLDPLGIQ